MQLYICYPQLLLDNFYYFIILYYIINLFFIIFYFIILDNFLWHLFLFFYFSFIFVFFFSSTNSSEITIFVSFLKVFKMQKNCQGSAFQQLNITLILLTKEEIETTKIRKQFVGCKYADLDAWSTISVLTKRRAGGKHYPDWYSVTAVW